MVRPLRIEFPGAVYHVKSQAAIAAQLGVHYSLVSKVIKQEVSRDSRFKT